MSGRVRQAASLGARLAGLYAAACVLGLACLVLAFKAGLLPQVGILFYRGLVLIVVAFAATFVLLAILLRWRRWRGLGLRDAFAASVLSLSLNLSFLVVVPVTVDRSISIFVLGQMAARPNETFTPERMAGIFTRVYIGDHRQIDRRLDEQAISGNVEKIGDGYRISSRGRFVIAASRLVADLFDSHAGLLAPDPAADRSAEPNPAHASR